MYNPMTPAPTPVSAWVDAARRLKTVSDLYGVMLHIEDPVGFGPGEEDVVCRVDAFLRDHDKCSVSTVSNTIFPADLDRGDGIEALTDRYMPVFERRMHRQGEWGRYFQRMVAWPVGSGKNVGTVNQLAENIRTLRAMREGEAKFFGNVTEIAPVRSGARSAQEDEPAMPELHRAEAGAGRRHVAAEHDGRLPALLHETSESGSSPFPA